MKNANGAKMCVPCEVYPVIKNEPPLFIVQCPKCFASTHDYDVDIAIELWNAGETVEH
jgi:hypothetical protein